MIGKLRGIIDSIESDHLILDVGGVGYQVFASQRVLAGCEVGAALALIIETHVREDHIHLYGFASGAEREAFRLLTTVQGVGVRMGMALLGQFNVPQLQTIIAAQDKQSLTTVSGVGAKLAERIVTELKNKVALLPAAGTSLAPVPLPTAKKGKAKAPALAENAASANHHEDAVSALVHLGYGRAEAFAAVARSQHNGESSLDGLIKAALRELAG